MSVYNAKLNCETFMHLIDGFSYLSFEILFNQFEFILYYLLYAYYKPIGYKDY